MKKVRIVILCIVVVALIAGYVIANKSEGTDSEQVLAVIERGRQSIQARDLSRAMSCVSKDYSDSGRNNYDKLRAMVGQGLRNSSALECTLSPIQLQVNGGTALARTHVVLTSTFAGERQKAFDGNVELYLKKENVRKYLIYPSTEWKVTSQEGIGPLSGGLPE